MRVCIACSFPRDERLGSSKVPLREADALRRLGVEVVEVFAENLPPPRRGRAAVYSTPFRMLAALASQGAGCDLVDIAGFDAWPYSIALRLNRGSAVVVARSNGLWDRALEAERPGQRAWPQLSRLVQRYLFCRWEEASIRRAHFARVMCRADRELIVNRGWKRRDEVFVVAPGIDDVFVPQNGSERPGVAFVGSWLYRKGSDIAAATLAALLRAHPEVPVAVLGSGAPAEWVRRDFPEPLRDQVEVIPSASPPELHRALSRFGVLIFPTRYEGYGMVVAEAMRSGLAVVTTPTGAGLDLVEDGENGLIVPVGDSRAMISAVLRLVENEALRDRLGREAASRTQSQTWEANARALLDVYSVALERGRHRWPSQTA